MTPKTPNVFERANWRDDRMLLDDLVFRLEHYKSTTWSGEEHFMFYKIKSLVEEYKIYFQRRPEFHPQQVLELGIFDGGSIAFWHELFQPRKHVALDLTDREDSPYFQKYKKTRQLEDRIKTFWRTNQADKPRLSTIVQTEFTGPIDLVIDDASHLYEPTLATFEAVFPLMPPGGIYIIEDWAWGHWREFHEPTHPWARETPPTKLVTELIEAVGTSNKIVAQVSVHTGFIAVERGPELLNESSSFSLKNLIVRRPVQAQSSRLKDRLINRFPRKLGFLRS